MSYSCRKAHGPVWTGFQLAPPSSLRRPPQRRSSHSPAAERTSRKGMGGREGEGWGAKGAAPLGRKGGEGDVGDSSAAP